MKMLAKIFSLNKNIYIWDFYKFLLKKNNSNNKCFFHDKLTVKISHGVETWFILRVFEFSINLNYI